MVTEHYKKYKETIKASVKRYSNTPRGKESIKKSKDKLIKNGWYNEYMFKRRQELKKRGICIRCGKEKPFEKRVQCKSCLDGLRERSIRYNQKRRQTDIVKNGSKGSTPLRS